MIIWKKITKKYKNFLIILFSVFILIGLPFMVTLKYISFNHPKSVSSLNKVSAATISPTLSILNNDSLLNSPGDVPKTTAPVSNEIYTKLNKKFTPIKITILMYHHIRIIDPMMDLLGQRLSVTPTNFDKQLSELYQKGYVSLSFQDIINHINTGKSLPPKSVMLTFDDGYENAYTNALPILNKYNYKGNFGIITGMVGKNGYMNWNQIKDLKKQGNEIDSHTVTHPDLAKLNLQKLIYELKESKTVLDSQLSQNTQTIIYPSGKYSPLVEDISASLGYLLGRSTDPGNTISPDNIMKMQVLRMFDNTDLNKHF